MENENTSNTERVGTFCDKCRQPFCVCAPSGTETVLTAEQLLTESDPQYFDSNDEIFWKKYSQNVFIAMEEYARIKMLQVATQVRQECADKAKIKIITTHGVDAVVDRESILSIPLEPFIK